jgi:hypothetical protein
LTLPIPPRGNGCVLKSWFVSFSGKALTAYFFKEYEPDFFIWGQRFDKELVFPIVLHFHPSLIFVTKA